MGIYKNGRDVLPPTLLKQVQQYIDGELLYIPKQDEQRAGWGELSGSKERLKDRNEAIYQAYCSGTSTDELERVYFLSGESIRKIISKLSRVTS
ncbi:hypothetical protein J40TS1_22310 [Paenibacillus montaniterrae]|uniref:Mor transcription activator domain-containing protein n=1 Tax=Paenibacillus montaniterrae TaxID=429341 RepID=A0A919YQS8_9BACL|nr:CD3324 family protein [Paenibacillus montaniterrae]GIP16589.1 hypothetical protein J40TS1_22310 [Paenibacillus montaniterrae]